MPSINIASFYANVTGQRLLRSSIANMTVTKNIVAIPGSLRAGSSNHAILRYLGSLTPVDVEYQIYEELAALPHFDPDLGNDQTPSAVAELRQLLGKADAVIICSPEYAFGVPGSLKNLLDWTVGSGSLEGKPLVLITASTGGQHAHAALQLILKNALGANLTKDAALLIPFVRTKMDMDGNMIDIETIEALHKVFNVLLAAL